MSSETILVVVAIVGIALLPGALFLGSLPQRARQGEVASELYLYAQIRQT